MYSEICSKAMPIKPSGGKCADPKPSEYCFAAPTLWLEAVRPPMVTVSEKTSPETVEPSPYLSENCWPRSLAELLLEVSYAVWPEQVSPQSLPGRKRSLEPVSKSTARMLVG